MRLRGGLRGSGQSRRDWRIPVEPRLLFGTPSNATLWQRTEQNFSPYIYKMSLVERFRRLQEESASLTHEESNRKYRLKAELSRIYPFEIFFDEAVEMLSNGQIVRSEVDPSKQADVRPGNARVTLHHRNGRWYTVEVRLDPATGQIYPPVHVPGRGRLVMVYPPGRPYYEIGGNYYDAIILIPSPINVNQSTILEIAEIRTGGPRILVSVAQPQIPPTPDEFVLLEMEGPYLTISPATPRRQTAPVLRRPLTSVFFLATPNLRAAPSGPIYPALEVPPIHHNVVRVLNNLLRNGLALEDFEETSQDLIGDEEDEEGEEEEPYIPHLLGIHPLGSREAINEVLMMTLTTAGPIPQSVFSGGPQTPGPSLPSAPAYTGEALRQTSFERARQMIQQGEITRYVIDPEHQEGVLPGSIRVTLLGIDGREYDVIARYDPATGMIYPLG